MVDEHFNLNIEYLSNPRIFSKNSFIFSTIGSCVSDCVIEKAGSNSALVKSNVTFPPL
jgi:hypothetical protein